MAPFCPQLKVNGVCTTAKCTYSHDITLYCTLCKVICPSASHLHDHQVGVKHQKAVGKVVRRCVGCAMDIVGGPAGWSAHCAGPRHLQRLASIGGTNTTTQPRTAPRLYCNPCKRSYQSKDAWDFHIASTAHRGTLQLLSLGATIKGTERDKFGVVVSPEEPGIDLGVIDARQPRGNWARSATFTIRVSTRSVRLAQASFSSTKYVTTFRGS